MKAKRIWTRSGFVIGAMLLMGMPLIAACAPAAEAPAVEEEKYIVVYEDQDLSGAYAVLNVPLFKGTQDYYKWVNEQGGFDAGGIKGIKVRHVWADNNNILARSMANYKRYLGSTPRPAIICDRSTPVGEMLKDIVAKDKVVLFNSGSNSDHQLYPPAWSWFGNPSYSEDCIVLLDWYAKNRYQGEGPMKVGHLTWDTAYGRAPVEASTRWGKEKGTFEVVAVEFMPTLPPDTTPQLTKLKEAGVDFIFSNSLTQAINVVLRDVDKLGLDIPVGSIRWAYPTMQASISGKAAEGYFYAHQGYLAEETDQPGVKFAWDLGKTYRGADFKLNAMYMYGIQDDAIVVEVCKRAVEAKGSLDIAGEDVRAAFATMKGFAGPGVWPPLSGPEHPNDRRLALDTRIYETKGGVGVPVSDWIRVPHTVPAEYQDLFK